MTTMTMAWRIKMAASIVLAWTRAMAARPVQTAKRNTRKTACRLLPRREASRWWR